MKKTLSVMLSLLLLIQISPFGVFTFTTLAETEGYYTYTVSNGEATITDADSSLSGDVTIPSTLGGYPVTKIGEKSFYRCDKITSIVIPDSIAAIGKEAFEIIKKPFPVGAYKDWNGYCTNLKRVYIRLDCMVQH